MAWANGSRCQSKSQPEKSDTARQDDHRVIAGKRVGETLRRRLLFARALDQVDDALHRALARQTPHPDDRLALQIHRATAHRIAGAFRNRERFAGEGRFIAEVAPSITSPSTGKEIARFDQQLIAHA